MCDPRYESGRLITGRKKGRGLSSEEVNRLAYQAEQIAHGKASGIDNSVATYGRPILFKRGDPPSIRHVSIKTPTQMVVGLTGREGLTAGMVSKVARGREANPFHENQGSETK